MAEYKVIATSRYEYEVEGLDEDDAVDGAIKLFEEEVGGLLHRNAPSLFVWVATEIVKKGGN